MSKEMAKPLAKRKFNYLSAIISIAMVLFMLGLFGLLLLQSKNLVKQIKENLVIQVFLADNLTKDQMGAIKQALTANPEVKTITYISKDMAAQQFGSEIGQDFVSFLGYNPLLSSYQITLHAQYIEPETLANFENKIKNLAGVTEVVYQKNIYSSINDNLKTLATVFVGLAVLFMIIAVVLINNTVRLHLYAQRFIVKSMQLVGATHWFIIKPFILKSISNGFIGALIAIALLIGILNLAPQYIIGIETLYQTDEFILLFAGLILAGQIISIFSSWFSTKKYLNSRIEDLY